MSFNTTLPGISSKKSTHDSIVSILSEKQPLTAKEIYNTLNREYGNGVSYQGIHKTVLQLVEERVIEKNDKKYHLNEEWVKEVANFGKKLEQKFQMILKEIDDNGSVNIPTGQAYKINGNQITPDDLAEGATYKKYSATEQTKLAGIEAAADVTDAVNVGTSIHGAAPKASLVDGDKFAIIDSEAANVLKTSLWSVIKATLKTYFMGLYVCREVPTGTKNGSNTDFTLANTPVSGTEMVFVNGLLMNAGAGNDYTISTNTITFLTGCIPISTDTILVTYWK